MRRLCCCIILLTLSCVHLWAQDTAQPDEPEITVVVTAERTPQPVSESISSATVVTAKQIRDQGAQTVGDALRLVPGVTIRQYGQMGAAGVRSRGTDAKQTLVLVDGQRISSPAFITGTDLSKFPVSNIDRIEVIRGPVSSLYGSEAIGGVINIITKQSTGRSGDVVLGFGGHGQMERSLALNGANDRMSWQFTSALPTYFGAQPNSDYSATNMSGRITLPSVKGWQTSLRAEGYHDTLELPGPVSSPSPNDHQWWDRTTAEVGAGRDILGG